MNVYDHRNKTLSVLSVYVWNHFVWRLCVWPSDKITLNWVIVYGHTDSFFSDTLVMKFISTNWLHNTQTHCLRMRTICRNRSYICHYCMLLCYSFFSNFERISENWSPCRVKLVFKRYFEFPVCIVSYKKNLISQIMKSQNISILIYSLYINI